MSGCYGSSDEDKYFENKLLSKVCGDSIQEKENCEYCCENYYILKSNARNNEEYCSKYCEKKHFEESGEKYE